jgi:hypothetical protein
MGGGLALNTKNIPRLVRCVHLEIMATIGLQFDISLLFHVWFSILYSEFGAAHIKTEINTQVL